MFEPDCTRALETSCAWCQEARAISDCLSEDLGQSVPDFACLLDMVHRSGWVPYTSQVILVLAFLASSLAARGLPSEGGVVDDS